MDIRELINLSIKSLAANKLRSFLTTLGIIIGVFAIIVLVSVGTGLQSYITNQIQGFGSNLIFVIPGRIGGARTPGGVQVNKLTFQDAASIQIKLRGVARVAPVIQQSATAKYKNKQDKGTSILGTTANYPETVKNSTLKSGVYFGQSQVQSGAKVAVIGQTVINDIFGGDQTVIGKRVGLVKLNFFVS